MMKKLFLGLVLIGVAMSAFAQTYPVTNPTYIPNLRTSSAAIVSGVANTAVTLNTIGTTSVQITGTCTSLAASLQGTNDGTNYVTLNLYPNGSLSTASAVTSMTATGYWVANTAGMNKVRINNTAVSGTACVGTLAGSANAFSLPH